MRRALAMLLLVAGTIIVPATGVSAQTEAGGVGIRLLEAPTEREKDPRALRSIVDHVKPGATFTRRFEVSNTTSGQRLIAIYAAAADVQGGTFVPADGRTQNELSGWITIDTANADLGPGQSAQPRLTVTVPPNASAGERYAVVWAELPPSRPPAGGVAVVNRVGPRVYLSVGPGGEPRTDFVIESLAAERNEADKQVVKATVRNTGGRALDLSGNLRLLNGPGGLSAGPLDAKLGTTLAIGATAPVVIELTTEVPDGPWLGRLELRSSTTVRTAEATITFPSNAGTTSPPVAAQPVEGKPSSSSSLPLVLAVVGGLLLLGIVVLVFLLTRRRSGTPTVALPLDDVLTELRTAEGKRRNELMGMAAAYGKEAIMASPALKALPVETARDLGERVAKAGR